MNTPYTKEQLQESLRKAGLLPTDTVLVHSSFSKMGEIEGGHETVLDALEEYFCQKGLLVFPAMTYSLIHPWSQDNQRCQTCPVPEHYCFAHGLALDAPRIFRQNMPCCVGKLPNLFLKRPGVFRSLSVTSSVAAKGKDAQEFTSGHELCESGCSQGSPWQKMVFRKGKILLLGVPITRMSFLHGVAEWSRPSKYYSPDFTMPIEVYRTDGTRVATKERRPVCGYSPAFANFETPLRNGGAIQDFLFGNAASMVVNCQKTWEIVGPLIRESPDSL